jgi:hypothetical protein
MEEYEIKYTDNPDFNEWLDDNEEVIIYSLSFPPSEVLYKMNYEQYCMVLNEYLDDDQLLLQEIYQDFPTPIAYYMREAEENYDNAHHRLDLLKSAWESLIFIIFGIVVSEARHRNFNLRDVGVNLSDYYSDKLALKLRIIENILNFSISNNLTMKCCDIIELDVITMISDLNKKRNSFAHSFAKTEEQQEELYNELFPEMIKILKKVRELQRLNLFRYHETKETPLHPRCYVFNGFSLNGAKNYLQINQDDYIKIIDYFDRKKIFAHIDNVVFCVSPFIHFKNEGTHKRPVLLFYKKKRSEGKYLFEIISHSEEIELEKIIFIDRDADLRNLVI